MGCGDGPRLPTGFAFQDMEGGGGGDGDEMEGGGAGFDSLEICG